MSIGAIWIIALAVANPPIMVLIDAPAVAYAPDGQRIELPAGTVLDACGPVPIVYDLDGSTVRVTQPCAERTLFSNGFEDLP